MVTRTDFYPSVLRSDYSIAFCDSGDETVERVGAGYVDDKQGSCAAPAPLCDAIDVVAFEKAADRLLGESPWAVQWVEPDPFPSCAAVVSKTLLVQTERRARWTCAVGFAAVIAVLFLFLVLYVLVDTVAI